MTNNLTENLDEEVRLTIEKMLDFAEVSGCIVKTIEKPVEESVWNKTIATQGLGSEFSEALDEGSIVSVIKERGAQHFDLLARNDSAKVYPAVAVPMTVGQNVIGVLTVIGWPFAPNFNETMVKFFTTLGSTIGQLIKSIERGNESYQRYMVAEKMVSIRAKLLFASNKNIIYDTILKEIQDYYDAKWCVLRFIDKETGDLVMAAGNEDIEKIAKRISPKGTLLEKVIQSKTVQTIEDTACCDFKILPYFSEDIRSLAVAPILVNNVICGTLKVYFPDPHHWHREEVEHLQMLGELLGLLMGDIELHESLKNKTRDVIYSLTKALEAKSIHTLGHSSRVAETAVACGRALGLSEEEIVELEQAALVHDIGKIGVRDSILSKPGTLDKMEWEEIQTHPQTGFDILKDGDLSESILLGVLHHHEDFNGGGYPAGLVGEEISLLARVIRIADAYDAMISDRPYRKGMSIPIVVEKLRQEAGRQFDPRILEVFLSVI